MAARSGDETAFGAVTTDFEQTVRTVVTTGEVLELALDNDVSALVAPLRAHLAVPGRAADRPRPRDPARLRRGARPAGLLRRPRRALPRPHPGAPGARGDGGRRRPRPDRPRAARRGHPAPLRDRAAPAVGARRGHRPRPQGPHQRGRHRRRPDHPRHPRDDLLAAEPPPGLAAGRGPRGRARVRPAARLRPVGAAATAASTRASARRSSRCSWPCCARPSPTSPGTPGPAASGSTCGSPTSRSSCGSATTAGGCPRPRRESGLRHARRRALLLGGSLDLWPYEPSGTIFVWSVPLRATS